MCFCLVDKIIFISDFSSYKANPRVETNLGADATSGYEQTLTSHFGVDAEGVFGMEMCAALTICTNTGPGFDFKMLYTNEYYDSEMNTHDTTKSARQAKNHSDIRITYSTSADLGCRPVPVPTLKLLANKCMPLFFETITIKACF